MEFLERLASPSSGLLTNPFQSATMIVGVIIGGFIMNMTPNVHANEPLEHLEKSPRHQEWVKITAADGRVIDAFVVFPEVKEKATAVVVIHEIFGLTDWVRSVGDELAKHGFVAICPDLLSGAGPKGGGTDSFASGDDVRKAIRDLDADKITTDLKAVVKYVRDLPSTTEKVAVAGFCWGGGQTFRFATNDASIGAAFVFYGGPPRKEDIGRIACPVYGFYGENDERINATIEDTKGAMAEAGKLYEPVIYPGVGHAFLRRGTEDSANEAEKAATREAWERFVKRINQL